MLVGITGDNLLQEPLYAEHHVCASVFPHSDDAVEPGRGARRRSGVVASGGPTVQDRLGFHSFRRGDIVRFTNALEGESAEAWVHSFMYKPAANGAQGRKCLVLFEPDSSVFFVQNTPSWSRVCKDAEDGFDCDDDARAAVIDAADSETMIRVSRATLGVYVSITNTQPCILSQVWEGSSKLENLTSDGLTNARASVPGLGLH